PDAKKIIDGMKIDEAFDSRKQISVEEYEKIEEIRETYIDNPNFVPDFTVADNWYDKHYKGKGFVILKEVKEYYRTYELS
ncbi:MAG: hypothetical protein KAS64_07960, partial [Spirochaetes bacterium]|nr:hypothetical protein [Spirochaetota bacterium]